MSAHEKPNRNQVVEALRLLAAFGIVAFHSGAGHREIAYAGLIVFLAISPMVDAEYNWNRVRTVTQLSKTFLLPWAFWMAIYGALNLLHHQPLFPKGEIVLGILLGTSQHLWFLPFMFVVLVLLNGLKREVDARVLFWISASVATTLFALPVFWRSLSLAAPAPISEWIHAVPPVIAGLTIGLSRKAGTPASAALIVVAVALSATAFAAVPMVSIPYVLGLILVAIAWRLPTSWRTGMPNIQPISACMMGLYLVHPLWLLLVGKVVGYGTYSEVVLAFICALISVFTVRRLVPRSRLVLG